jgi:hypothetical protein
MYYTKFWPHLLTLALLFLEALVLHNLPRDDENINLLSKFTYFLVSLIILTNSAFLLSFQPIFTAEIAQGSSFGIGNRLFIQLYC